MNYISQIISGGGWKNNQTENIRVKAWIVLFLAIVLGGVAIAGPDGLEIYTWILAGICMLLSVVLFIREKPQPTSFSSGRTGDDLRKLHNASGHESKQP